ncbi:polyprenyl synthetase [Streptomyces sp. NPDC051320]|uniref:polyprenyl synthetase n=1 Tax=Streptomyces sp. NPDC051320 TaxID=3154644 RepID=UPI003431D884
MTPAGDGAGDGRGSDAVLVAAGVADLMLSGVGSVLRGARGLLRRSDLAELAQDGQEEMKARGRLALERSVSLGEPHMELLARRCAAAGPGQRDA